MKKICLYISSFVPMYLLLLIKILLEIINHNLTFNVLNTTLIILLSLLIILGCIGLFVTINHDKEKPIKITIVKKENITDQHFLGYFSLFVLFSLTFEIERVSMSVIFILILILVGIVYINSKLFYINPLLNILGYSFYNITFYTENPEELRNAKIFYKGELVLNKQTYLVKLTNENFCFVDKKKDKQNKN